MREINLSTHDFFENGPVEYCFDTQDSMDNIESMHYFIDCVGLESYVIEDYGTMAIIQKDENSLKYVIHSSGRGDFYSHLIEVEDYVNEN